MAINLEDLDRDLEFVALNTIEGSEREHDREVTLRNVFYVEDILNILFHNPRGVIKYNDTPFCTSDLNDGAEFVTKWFTANAYKLDLNIIIVGHDVMISSRDWRRTLKVLQTYNDETEVKALAEGRATKFIQSSESVDDIDECGDAIKDWKLFISASNNAAHPCQSCTKAFECCKDCTHDHMEYERFQQFKERLMVK